MTAAELSIVADLVARCGCPLAAAARYPEHRSELMTWNADLETAPVQPGSDAAAAKVQRAVEDVLRARVRKERAAA